MASDAEEHMFALVVAKKKGAEVKTKLEMKMLSLTKEAPKESMNIITIEEGRIMITQPKEDIELKISNL